jgi:hypothetical protein
MGGFQGYRWGLETGGEGVFRRESGWTRYFSTSEVGLGALRMEKSGSAHVAGGGLRVEDTLGANENSKVQGHMIFSSDRGILGVHGYLGAWRGSRGTWECLRGS